MEAEKKPKSKTLSAYRGYQIARASLYGGIFALPLAPATIITLINWEEWFVDSNKTLPFGFASLLLTVIVAIVGVLNSGTVFKKVDIALYFLAGLLMCIGITCMFLASLFTQMGYMWLYTGAGILGSGICYTVEDKIIKPQITFYKGLIESNSLDNKTKRKLDRIERARREAEREAKELEERRKRATTE